MAEFVHQGRRVVFDRDGEGDPVVLTHNAGSRIRRR